MAITTGNINVTIEITSYDIEARCACGEVVAGHHWQLETDPKPMDTQELTTFFHEAFARHVAEAHQRHALVLSVKNVQTKSGVL